MNVAIVLWSFQVPNIGRDVKIEKAIVQFYNFRSMVAKVADELKEMISIEPMDVIDNGAASSVNLSPPTTPPSLPPPYKELVTPRCDLLKGMNGLNFIPGTR